MAKNETYEEFVEKFKPKKTTDDCYTPPIVYDAVADYVASHYGLDKSTFVRPFYPGGDYESEDYTGKIVVDNPPFSIFSKIVKFYCCHGVRFFLFAPHLTFLNSASNTGACAIVTDVKITYENGARISTSFLTNLEHEDLVMRTSPTLYRAVKTANKKSLKQHTKTSSLTYIYPYHVLTSSRLSPYSRCGIQLEVPRSETSKIRYLDEQKAIGKAIYGSGLLVSDRLAKMIKKAEQEKAVREKIVRFELSNRERKIVKSLNAV